MGRRSQQAAIMPNQPPMASLRATVVTNSGTSSVKPEPTTVPSTRTGQGGGGGIGGAGGGGNAAAPPRPSGTLITEKDELMAIRALSPEEQKRADLQSKFHPSVLAVIDRLKDSKLKASPDEAKFIRNGKAEIQIWLTDKSAETLAKLKELGFEVVLDPKTAKLVIGRLPIEK